LAVLTLILLVIIFAGIANLVKKSIQNKKVFLKNLESNVSGLTEDILKDLGPELTSILQEKIMKAIPPRERIVIQHVPVIQPQQQPSDMEIKLLQERAFMEKVWELQATISNTDLFRYKDFMGAIVNFEWCETCGSKGSRPTKLMRELSKDVSDLKLESQEIKSSKEEEMSDSHQGTGGLAKSLKEIADKTEPIECTECTEDCLYRYFKTAEEIGTQFKEKEKVIAGMKFDLELFCADNSPTVPGRRKTIK